MAPRINVSRTYRWIDKDPIIDNIKTILQDEGLNPSQCKDLSGVTVVGNWLYGDTRRPNNTTICSLTSALGYVRHDRLDRSGKLVVGFEKARDLNYRDEYEKQARFILKHGTTKQKAAARKTLADGSSRKFKNGGG